MFLTAHGIKTCDTCRKALKALEQAGIAHRSRDLRTQPLKPEEAARWLDQIGADRLINRRSTTWRGLAESDRAIADGDDAAAIAALLAREVTLIKRPVFTDEDGDDRVVALGFDAQAKAAIGLTS